MARARRRHAPRSRRRPNPGVLTWLWQEFTNTQPERIPGPVRREPPRGKSRTAAKTRVYRPVEQRQDAARRRREDAAERAERRREELHELHVQRAAAALRLAQERANLVAERRAEQAERARSRAERERLKALQKTQEHKAGEFEDMARKAEAGQLTGDQLRYFINTYGRGVKKKGT